MGEKKSTYIKTSINWLQETRKYEQNIGKESADALALSLGKRTKVATNIRKLKKLQKLRNEGNNSFHIDYLSMAWYSPY